MSRRRFKGRNYHHFFLAKAQGGGTSPNNLLLIDIEKHEAFNRLFGSQCSAEHALELLTRVVRAKQNQQLDYRTEDYTAGTTRKPHKPKSNKTKYKPVKPVRPVGTSEKCPLLPGEKVTKYCHGCTKACQQV